MRCKTFLSRLPEWLDATASAGDGAVAPATVGELEAHARTCPTCAAELVREQRLVAMLDGGLVDPPLPARLRDRVHRAVDALAIVEARPMAPAVPATATHLYAHPIAIQWLSMSAVLAITLTTGLAAGRSLAPAPGETVPTSVDRRAATDPSQPERHDSLTIRNTAGADGHQVMPIDEPVAEQLARHLDTTERLYHRVLHAPTAGSADERRTRAFMNAELAVSQIQRDTPALRVAIVRDPTLTESARGYFDEAETFYSRIEAWVDSPNVELAAVRGELERLPLPRQIQQMRVALGRIPSHAVRAMSPEVARLLPPEVMQELAGIPGSGIYVQFLQEYHRGRTHEAFGRLQQLRAVIERSPRSPLAEDYDFWVERVSPEVEAQCEIAILGPNGRREVMVQPFAVAQFEALRRSPECLAIDGRRHALRSASEAAVAFTVLWKAAEARQLELGRAGQAGGLVVTDAETHQTTTGADAKTPTETLVLRQVALEIPAVVWSKDVETAYSSLCLTAVPPPSRASLPRILQITVPLSDLPRDR